MEGEKKVLMEVRRGKQSIVYDLIIFLTYVAIFIVLMAVLHIPATLKEVINETGGIPPQVLIGGALFVLMTAYFLYAFVIRSIMCFKSNKVLVTNQGIEFHKGLTGKKIISVPYDEFDQLYIVTPYATVKPDNRELILTDTYGRRFKFEGVKSPAITYLLINEEIATVIGKDRIKPYIKGGVEYSFDELKRFRQIGQEKRTKREVQFDDDLSNGETEDSQEKLSDKQEPKEDENK